MSLPGHVYCKRCLTDYANTPGNNDLSAKCPACRASFDLSEFPSPQDRHDHRLNSLIICSDP